MVRPNVGGYPVTILPYQERNPNADQSEKATAAQRGYRYCLGPASYELRIGSVRGFDGGQETILEAGRKFVMEPASSALIGTVEEIRMPADLAGLLFLKSSLGRSGYIPWSQGFVDPGYTGSLTIALHNVAGKLQLFEGHQKICHLVFVKLTKATSNPYAGEYKDSVGATEAKQKPPIVISPLRGVSKGIGHCRGRGGEDRCARGC
jgi:deoxycytidine triphosphate deaminase